MIKFLSETVRLLGHKRRHYLTYNRDNGFKMEILLLSLFLLLFFISFFLRILRYNFSVQTSPGVL